MCEEAVGKEARIEQDEVAMADKEEREDVDEEIEEVDDEEDEEEEELEEEEGELLKEEDEDDAEEETAGDIVAMFVMWRRGADLEREKGRDHAPN